MGTSYSDEELDRYFEDRSYRHQNEEGDGWLSSRISDPRKRQAAVVVGAVALLGLFALLLLGGFFLALEGDRPDARALENPQLDLATVAYTADGEVLARYAMQNRSWMPFDSIATPVVQALIATEDHRFYSHWGVDVRGLFAVAFEAATTGDLRGASTITQQLARNLYNKQIGREVTVERKIKEMITAAELERRYTKQEILEMYLNTVEFGYQSYGIEAAARTFYDKSASQLDTLEAAMLVGLLKATSRYSPLNNPELAMQRRSVVLNQMVRNGYLSREWYDEHHDDPLTAEYYSSTIQASLAPYFAEHVRNWLADWGRANGHNIYTEGLTVHTTLDSRMQSFARSTSEQKLGQLQNVVDREWSRSASQYTGYPVSQSLDGYEPVPDEEAFDYYWESKDEIVQSFVRETQRFRTLVEEEGLSREEALSQLRSQEAFMDSLKTAKTRIQGGFVAMDPRNGYVKAWIGGRGFEDDKYDHVSIAKRQPGSTFKPFVYTAAIDNGYSPYYTLPDSTVCYETVQDEDWCPSNFGESTGTPTTLRRGLTKSLNTISSQLIMEIQPKTTVFYAHRMGIESDLQAVPSLALGTSNVTLLEMATAYSTLANGGLRREPVVVTRIEDRNGNVLFEHQPTPEEAISETTAYTVVDMMRGVINEGTGGRIRWQYQLRDYDFAGKTGTTQNAADGWFMLMHPELVTGGWVGFNDQRVTFRTNWWGQGAHNALHLVGGFWRQFADAEELQVSTESFPIPEEFGGQRLPAPGDSLGTEPETQETDRGRVGW